MNANMPTDWSLPIKCHDEFRRCDLCGEPYCDECELHYFECRHPGPHSEPEDDDLHLELAPDAS